MAAIKRDAADAAVSDAVRERAHWTCERCLSVSVDGQAQGKCRGLEASHYFGRANRATRWHPDNIFCLCTGCHSKVGGDPELHAEFVLGKLGDGLLDILRERKNDTRIKYTKKDRKLIAAHYRAEYRRLRALRANGATGRIELVAYD